MELRLTPCHSQVAITRIVVSSNIAAQYEVLSSVDRRVHSPRHRAAESTREDSIGTCRFGRQTRHRTQKVRSPSSTFLAKAMIHWTKAHQSAWGGYRSFGSMLHDAYRRVLHRDLKRRLIAKSLLGADILSVAVCGLYAVITCTVQRSISMLSSDSPRRIFSATSQVSDTVVCQLSEVLGCLRGLRSPQVFCSRPKL